MFGLFNKKSPIEKLKEQQRKLQDEAFQLSKTNRSASDKKTAEANALDAKIAELRAKEEKK